MDFRFARDADFDALFAMWLESGWVKNTDEDKAVLRLLLSCGRTLVRDIDARAETMVLLVPGTLRHLNNVMPLSVVGTVMTSRIARKQGWASRLTAEAIALDALEGFPVSALGIFEQGYYNRLGYGSGPYEHIVRFDPNSLITRAPYRIPTRFGLDQAEQVFALHQRRFPAHGQVSFTTADNLRVAMMETTSAFGLGYFDAPGGTLSHGIWVENDSEGENGPYGIKMMLWETADQFHELLSILRSLGDQVSLLRIKEPPGLQWQDFLDKPFSRNRVSEKSPYASGNGAISFWQMRICDLAGCLAQTHLTGETLRFNLKLHDPIGEFLEPDAPWRGISDEYVVTLGPESAATAGNDAGLPTLDTTVGAFTRLWLGANSATGLHYSDTLIGPPALLAALDRVLCLPTPHTDLEF